MLDCGILICAQYNAPRPKEPPRCLRNIVQAKMNIQYNCPTLEIYSNREVICKNIHMMFFGCRNHSFSLASYMAGILQFINITNLTADTTYMFVCYAGNVAGVGEKSDPAEFMTCKCVIV